MENNIIESNKNIEEKQDQLCKFLRKEDKKILFVIDDIDRLNEDQTIQIFSIIKSVAHLPNVIYLLLYDRALVENVISKKFPAEEGKHYLEKMVQASFNIPHATPFQLRQAFAEECKKIGISEDDNQWNYEEGKLQRYKRYLQIYTDIISPCLRKPRDVVRLINILKVSYPAIKGEVDAIDFLAIETIRLFKQDLYVKIRDNRLTLVNVNVTKREGKNDIYSMEIHPDHSKGFIETNYQGQEIYEKFKKDFLSEEKDIIYNKECLSLLFPRTSIILKDDNSLKINKDMTLSENLYTYEKKLQKEKWISSRRYFDNYFVFYPNPKNVSPEEFKKILEACKDREKIKQYLLKAREQRLDLGETQAGKILEELSLRSDEIPTEAIEPLLIGIFSCADDLLPGGDNNDSHIVNITKSLLDKGFSQREFEEILQKALKESSLYWNLSFAEITYSLILPESEEAKKEFDKAEKRLYESGELQNHPRRYEILSLWYRINRKGKNGLKQKAKEWATQQINEDKVFLIHFLKIILNNNYITYARHDHLTKHRNYLLLPELVPPETLLNKTEELRQNKKEPEENRKIAEEFLKNYTTYVIDFIDQHLSRRRKKTHKINYYILKKKRIDVETLAEHAEALEKFLNKEDENIIQDAQQKDIPSAFLRTYKEDQKTPTPQSPVNVEAAPGNEDDAP